MKQVKLSVIEAVNIINTIDGKLKDATGQLAVAQWRAVQVLRLGFQTHINKASELELKIQELQAKKQPTPEEVKKGINGKMLSKKDTEALESLAKQYEEVLNVEEELEVPLISCKLYENKETALSYEVLRFIHKIVDLDG